jgi:SNW domain-containing protein 1
VARLTQEQRKQQNIKLFVPRSLADFDDGGAFPEIHIAQYPRHMGNPHIKKAVGGAAVAGAQSKTTAIVNVQVDEKGDVSYDAIVKGGTNADKTVYSKYEDLRGGAADPDAVALATREEEEETKRRTSEALGSLLSKQTALDKASGSAMVNAATSQNQEEKTQFIKYTPRPDAPGYNPAAAQRVIQMVPAQIDPMAPPKHKHIKAPRGPAEDPVPVLHAPPTKLSKEERDAWNVPACISNWKNTRGYTIPLDKRLAADGRGLREHSINPNFATLSESLYVAERQARQEVRMRTQVQKRLVLQDKEQREEELRQLANQARMERSGVPIAASTVAADNNNHRDAVSDDEEASPVRETDDDVAARQRERLRLERKKERERELRLESNQELKKQKFEQERDISEKIALGVHTGHGGGLSGEVDSRLYNQTAGMDSGFGAEDEYNTYSKPLFDRQGVTAGSVYRPTRGETEYNADEQYDKLVDGATSKFQPDKGFAGAQGGGSAGARTAPVQFEKERK